MTELSLLSAMLDACRTHCSGHAQSYARTDERTNLRTITQAEGKSFSCVTHAKGNTWRLGKLAIRPHSPMSLAIGPQRCDQGQPTFARRTPVPLVMSGKSSTSHSVVSSIIAIGGVASGARDALDRLGSSSEVWAYGKCLELIDSAIAAALETP